MADTSPMGAPSAALSAGAPARQFSERLWLGPLGWAVVVALGVVLGVVLLPVDTTLALVAGVIGVAGGLAVAVLTTPRVEVAGGTLRAGSAHIPARLVGPARVLAGDELRTQLGPELDARAFLCIRGWVHQAVRVELHDPADPTPYWVVSTRSPDRLVSALVAAGARGSTPRAGRRPRGQGERGRAEAVAAGHDDGRPPRGPAGRCRERREGQAAHSEHTGCPSRS